MKDGIDARLVAAERNNSKVFEKAKIEIDTFFKDKADFINGSYFEIFREVGDM